jgi:aryl-alcohol dehydrogenase-like predicted oxidoreductase
MVTQKLILGTVQLGITYGINNIHGKVNKEDSFDILRTAYNNGIRYLDTADRYGDASDVIGSFHKSQPGMCFEVITKFEHELGLNIADWLQTTLKRLNVDHLYGCMCPAIEDENLQNQLLEELTVLKHKGLIYHVGFSLYTNEELERAINDDRLSLFQMPFNLLDNKHCRQHIFSKAKQAGKIIHTRSVFLQGLFYMDENNLPSSLVPIKPYLNKIKDVAKEADLTISELALGYAVANDCIDGVLIGVDNVAQLMNNIAATDTQLNDEIFTKIDDIVVEKRDILDPRLWK